MSRRKAQAGDALGGGGSPSMCHSPEMCSSRSAMPSGPARWHLPPLLLFPRTASLLAGHSPGWSPNK